MTDEMKKEVDGAMETMNNENLTDEQKKDVETFARLPNDFNREMKGFMAGLLTAYSKMSNESEKAAG